MSDRFDTALIGYDYRRFRFAVHDLMIFPDVPVLSARVLTELGDSPDVLAADASPGSAASAFLNGDLPIFAEFSPAVPVEMRVTAVFASYSPGNQYAIQVYWPDTTIAFGDSTDPGSDLADYQSTFVPPATVPSLVAPLHDDIPAGRAYLPVSDLVYGPQDLRGMSAVISRIGTFDTQLDVLDVTFEFLIRQPPAGLVVDIIDMATEI